MTAVRHNRQFSIGNVLSQFLGVICRCQAIVFYTKDQNRLIDFIEPVAPVEIQQCLNSAINDFLHDVGSIDHSVGALWVVLTIANPPARIKEQWRGSRICRGTGFSEKLPTHLEASPKIGIRPSPGRVHNDARQTMWRFDQQYLGDRATGGVSNKMGCFESKSVHQTEGVRGHLLERIADARFGAPPRAAMVMDDHPENASRRPLSGAASSRRHHRAQQQA